MTFPKDPPGPPTLPLPLNEEGRNRDKLCDRFTTVVKLADEEFRYEPLNCKSKLCPRCAPKLAARRVRQIEAAVAELGLGFSVTLTVVPESLNPEEVLRTLRSSWNKFRVYFKRRHGEPLTYILVVEVTPDAGVPHFHILMRQGPDPEWLMSAWSAVGGGPFASIKPIDDARGLCEYLVKQIKVRPANALPPKTRLITTSRNIKLKDKGDRLPSRLIRQSIANARVLAGQSILRDTRDGFIASAGDVE